MTDMPSDRRAGLRQRAISGSFWSIVSVAFANLLRLGSNMVLTRLLTPEVFGLMALARVAMQLLTLVSDIGTKASIIRSERGEDPVFLQTAWTIQVVRSAGIFLGACILAWPISVIYGQPVLLPLTCVLAIASLVSGFRSLAESLLNRKVMLARVTLLAMAVQLVNILVTVLAAWYFRSVWALAVGAVVGSIVGVVASYIFLPKFDHKFRLERAAVWEIFGFGKWILAATLLTYFAGQGMQAIQGLLIPVETLGLITLAGALAWAPGQLVLKLMDSVTFPLMSEVNRTNVSRLKQLVRKTKFLLVAIPMPLCAILYAFGPQIIDLLYDDRYARAGTFLSIMALNGALGILPMPYQNLMLAVGNSKMHALVMGVSAGSKIVGLVAGYHLGGEIGMLIGIGIGNLVPLAVSLWFAARLGLAEMLLDLGVVAVIALAYSRLLYQ